MEMTASQIDVHVGRRVRQRREQLGLSQGSLGRKLGLTFSQVQKYEKGSNRIGAGRLCLLADFLGVPIEYFFEGLGEEQATQADRSAASDELAALQRAFVSIADPETRQSVLALVCSLTGTHLPPTGSANAFADRRPGRRRGGGASVAVMSR